jgi:Kdo2-lipid IVA lauroyltransferase/acyltransferase
MKKTRTTGIIIFLFRLIPLSLRKTFFQMLLSLFYYVSPKQRLIALHNLARAFPEKPLPELIAIAKGAYRNIGIMAAEFFEIPYINRNNIQQYMDVEGMTHLKEALKQNKGVLSIVAHFGNWEMMAAAVPAVAGPMHIVYRPLDNPVLENLINWVRAAHGNVMVPKEGAVLKAARLLGQKKIIGILIDQNMAAREGAFVNFFGRPACTTVSLAFLAMKTGAPVLPAFMIRMNDGRYKFLLQPAVELIDTGNTRRDMIANTQKFTDIIEDIVRQYPDQYFWVHQRWKTQLCQKE